MSGRHGLVKYGGYDPLGVGRWRGMVQSALLGRRGQRFLGELAAALDSIPDKRLVTGELDEYNYALEDDEGELCALGAACRARGIDPKALDPEDHERLGQIFDVAPCVIQEIEWQNDACNWVWEHGKLRERTPEERWQDVRRWVGAWRQRAGALDEILAGEVNLACNACGHLWSGADVSVDCPRCGRMDTRLVGGPS